MAKKTPNKKNTEPTFEVRLVRTGLEPGRIPLRAVSDVLSAVQDLASGRDPFETAQVPTEKAIGLIDVRKGSAIYSCVSRAPAEAVANLGRISELLVNGKNGDDDGLVAALRPIQSLSDVAKHLDCEVKVYLSGKRQPLFVVDKDDYQRISSHLLLAGETTVVGSVKRVGGATGMRCLMRVSGRRRILYCDVKDRQLVRRLGQHLYETIAAVGTAVWIHRSWRIVRFTITDFSQPDIGKPSEMLKELREAGLDAWDNIDNPAEYIGEFQA